jgi:hypothetical protein
MDATVAIYVLDSYQSFMSAHRYARRENWRKQLGKCLGTIGRNSQSRFFGWILPLQFYQVLEHGLFYLRRHLPELLAGNPATLVVVGLRETTVD